MRGTATVPNSPRDIMLGLVDPNEPIHSEIASKSNPRQTESLGPLLASMLMADHLPSARRHRPKVPTGYQAATSRAPYPPSGHETGLARRGVDDRARLHLARPWERPPATA